MPEAGISFSSFGFPHLQNNHNNIHPTIPQGWWVSMCNLWTHQWAQGWNNELHMSHGEVGIPSVEEFRTTEMRHRGMWAVGVGMDLGTSPLVSWAVLYCSSRTCFISCRL